MEANGNQWGDVSQTRFELHLCGRHINPLISNMTCPERNVLMSRCQTKQIKVICTCLVNWLNLTVACKFFEPGLGVSRWPFGIMTRMSPKLSSKKLSERQGTKKSFRIRTVKHIARFALPEEKGRKTSLLKVDSFLLPFWYTKLLRTEFLHRYRAPRLA